MIKVGILFGGPSREREISFAGGRTVYDNLNKSLFDPIPLFVDSIGNLILLNWAYIYKGTIRDFYPAPDSVVYQSKTAADTPFQRYIESLGPLTDTERDQLIGDVGRRIAPDELPNLIDIAFLCLHGPYGEDGAIQGLLEWYGVPYTGSGILPSAIGIDKLIQHKLLQQAGFNRPAVSPISKQTWLATSANSSDTIQTLLNQTIETIGLPIVVKSPSQGSSIGVSVLKHPDTEAFASAIDKSFFLTRLSFATWQGYSDEQRIGFVRTLVDIREGIGLPVQLSGNDVQTLNITDPDTLLDWLNTHTWTGELLLESAEGEEVIMLEAFIQGREFSCIVVQDETGKTIALPPTEILKGNDMFDYRSKYLPGMARKLTPIDLPIDQINAIRNQCKDLFDKLSFGVYARIDGFIGGAEKGYPIYLNDPNTTSGMLPSSFFFHQAAEVGLNPSQFLTYIIRTSLQNRLTKGRHIHQLRHLLATLDTAMAHHASAASTKTKVAVIMGGYSSERHISVESGRNIYEKLSSSTKYAPFPVFLTGDDTAHTLHLIPINLMLKDNADDIAEKALHPAEAHPVISQIRTECASITAKYAGEVLTKAQQISYEDLAKMADVVFIALHGRPGEDGVVQQNLERVGLPYNGSGPASSNLTINKYNTNKLLREAGISVADHTLVQHLEWTASQAAEIQRIEARFHYPFIAKPADDGCSSAVKKIKNREQLIAFSDQMFRDQLPLLEAEAAVLSLGYQEEFPQKTYYLIETLIERGDAVHFLEVTGGLITHHDEKGNRKYELFEPSEALASGEVLSLEEKFLAGEGQNITPARFAKDVLERQRISDQVKQTLQRTAELLNVEGYCRIDAFVRVYADGHVETVVIEVNSLPGMTPATCIFHQSAINGYKPYQFIDAILTYGQSK
jgi:D-alanine-D-alanine ligase